VELTGRSEALTFGLADPVMLAAPAAYFAKLWSAVAIEPPLWEGGGGRSSRGRSKHHTLRIVTLPPPSQSGGSIATALQSAAHEMRTTFSD